MRVQTISAGQDKTVTVVDRHGLPVDCIEDYLHYLRQTSSPHTVRAYARALARWFAHLDRTDHSWTDFPTTTYGDFLVWLRTGTDPGITSIGSKAQSWLAPTSVQQHAAAVMAFYTFQADAHGHTLPYDRLHRRGRAHPGRYRRFLNGIAEDRSPNAAYSVRGANVVRPPILDPNQVRLILDSLGNVSRHELTRARDRLLFHLLWETGARLGEALSITHGDVSTGRGNAPFIDVIARQDHPHGVRNKTTAARRIYISDRLEAEYAEYLWNLVDAGIDLDIADLSSARIFVNVVRSPLWSPMRVETVYQKVRAAQRACPQLPSFTPHWFRHTHATALLLAGTDPHVVMRRLGHADVQTTLNTYGWVTEDAQLQAFSAWTKLTEDWKGLA